MKEILCIIGSCISLQLGAALAVQLFPVSSTWGTAIVRLVTAGMLLCALVRPRVSRWTRTQWGAVVLFGASLRLMNGFFYAAIGRIPLGTAITIEFLGPLLLAAVLSRSLADALCVLLALYGIALLGLDSLTGSALDPVGAVFALITGGFWVCYILASQRAGRLVPGQGGLAVALLLGGVVLVPLGAPGAATITTDPSLLLLAAGTGLLASLIPYSLELAALRGLTPNAFSVLIALEPVFAAFFGWLLLAQPVTVLKGAAVCLVVAASILQTLTTSRRRPKKPASLEPVSC